MVKVNGQHLPVSHGFVASLKYLSSPLVIDHSQVDELHTSVRASSKLPGKN